MIDKTKILNNICYTELVYKRINKKLKKSFSKKQIEEYIYRVLDETDSSFSKIGKNFYIVNQKHKIKITINSNTFRIITVDNMKTKKIEIAAGAVHEIPEDLKMVLSSNPDLLAKWNSLTPLSRNEWICWITIVKKPETRKEHIERLSEELLEGKKRPCCWPGCPHRRRMQR